MDGKYLRVFDSQDSDQSESCVHYVMKSVVCQVNIGRELPHTVAQIKGISL